MSDLVPTSHAGTALESQMKYAQALAAASLIPKQYQRQPANILVAMEYGRSLGLDPVTAMQQVHVVDGKPTASAQLVAALVRRAGHRLRVTGDATRAVAEIIRHDDPDFVFRSEWTMDRAKAAQLTGKSVWKQYPDAMLKARAITEVARDACPEALSGVAYTPEELGAADVHVQAPTESTWTAEPIAAQTAVNVETGEIVDGEIEDPAFDALAAMSTDQLRAALGSEFTVTTATDTDDRWEGKYPKDSVQGATLVTERQAKAIMAVLHGLQIHELPAMCEALSAFLGRKIASVDDVFKGEVDSILRDKGAALRAHLDGAPVASDTGHGDADDPWGTDTASGKQVAMIRALFAELKIPADERPDIVHVVANRPVDRLEALNTKEASALITHLQALKGGNK